VGRVSFLFLEWLVYFVGIGEGYEIMEFARACVYSFKGHCGVKVLQNVFS
jgi:hypothetical protein